MKVGILTWHKALNHGAILQAYASQQFISNLGYDVLVLDYERKVSMQRSRKEKLLRYIDKILTGEFRYKLTYVNMMREKKAKFQTFQEQYLNNGSRYDEEHFDRVMIGSDMVFNLFQGYSDFMFGKGISTNRLFSYAASAGGSTRDLAVQMGVDSEIKDQLLHFSGLGYRDKETLRFITELSGRTDCVENIDPVLLYGFEQEKTSWDSGTWSSESPYLLIYSYFGNLNKKKETVPIRAFAKEKGLQIVSCGYYHPWCDRNVNADPKEFLEMIKYAQYVVTDTFHGTVFSLINRKPFCAMVRGNGFKLKYLLDQCGLSGRIADESRSISLVLNRDLDYSSYDEWIIAARKQSGDYIKDELERIE